MGLNLNWMCPIQHNKVAKTSECEPCRLGAKEWLCDERSEEEVNAQHKKWLQTDSIDNQKELRQSTWARPLLPCLHPAGSILKIGIIYTIYLHKIYLNIPADEKPCCRCVRSELRSGDVSEEVMFRGSASHNNQKTAKISNRFTHIPNSI